MEDNGINKRRIAKGLALESHESRRDISYTPSYHVKCTYGLKTLLST